MNKISIKEALTRASLVLKEADLDTPRREAEILLSASLSVPLAYLFAHDDEILSDLSAARFFDWVERRACFEPFAYLSGNKEFMGLPILVTPDVLIPRPETEILVETVVSVLKPLKHQEILEIGTGSGAVAVSLAVLLPNSFVTSCDLSPAALTVAAKNSCCHGVSDRILLLEGDLYEPVKQDKAYNIVVSNPPYIPTADLCTLPPDVRDYEPLSALDGGPDGLNFYKRLTNELSRLAQRPNFLAFEVGGGQAGKVARLCTEAGYDEIQYIRDYAGIERVILAVST